MFSDFTFQLLQLFRSDSIDHCADDFHSMIDVESKVNSDYAIYIYTVALVALPIMIEMKMACRVSMK